MSEKCVCSACGWLGTYDQLLAAPNPFIKDDTLYACPICKDMDLDRACDEPGCSKLASCGTPVPGGYRVTCFKHSPEISH